MMSEQAESHESMALDEQATRARSIHDIRASLAITNGFKDALEKSLSELCETYEQLLQCQHIPSINDVELKARAGKLEDDCHFCLSRIERSLKQLGTKIDGELSIRSHSQCSNNTDMQ